MADELKPLSREDQAQSQLQGNQPPQPLTPVIHPDQLDLSNPVVKEQMRTEYNEFWGMDRKDPVRSQLESNFYYKYYGMSPEEQAKQRQEALMKEYHPLHRLDRIFKRLSAPGLAYADFGMDVIGNLPGAAVLDNAWDRATRLDDDFAQGARRFLSIALPAYHSGGLLSKRLAASQAPRLTKLLMGMGAFGASEAAIIGLSDVGEEDNISKAFSDFYPEVFGQKGSIPLPDWLVTLDEDSPSVRRRKNAYEAGLISVLGTVLGAGITIGGKKKVMGWFKPEDKAAELYKATEVAKPGSPNKLIRMQEIETILSTESLSRQNQTLLEDELLQLKDELAEIDNIEDAVRRVEDSKETERNTSALNKLNSNPDITELDDDITPIIDEQGRQSIPPGNVARNIADTTAIKKGVSEGDPAPVITESMRTKGLMVGSTSRDAVMGVAEETRDIGRFNALVDGFRFTNKQMNAAAWDIYTSIIATENMDDLRSLFIENKDVKSMLLGRFNVEYINEEQARAAAFAMRDLTDRFLGRRTAEASARVMDTLGREAATIATAVQDLQPFVDDDRAMDLIIDKLQFLMDEYALNKYISGWQLRNKNWFDQVPPKEIDTVIEQLTTEFRDAENAIHAKNLRFTKTLKELAETNPLAMRPLVDAFAHTNGDVDTLTKLMKWADQQITPLGLLKSPDPKQLNTFARGTWAVNYNNVLSGISALRAALGNTTQVTLKPISAVLGHGIWGLADDFEGLKRSLYYHGAIFETNRRALRDAWRMMKRVHKEPDIMQKAIRKDFTFKQQQELNILDEMLPLWKAQNNVGKIAQYNTIQTLHKLASYPWARYGMTGMAGADAWTSTYIATYMSRLRAYDDVFSANLDPELFEDLLLKAEKKHYKAMFDNNGVLIDKAAKNAAGEIALNLDDGLATWLNQGTTAYPVAKHLFMFPRTASNSVKVALSWQPISLIPGINKYSKTIWAQTDEDIAAALAEHGLDMAREPNARVIFENLRAEYTGRLAFSLLLTKSLWDYTMGGNIRGNGHYNASRRTKERNQLGYEPKTIKIGNKWVSYKGIIGVDQVLSILGDMAYYGSDLEQSLMEDWHAKLAWTISATFLNETPLQGIEPLIAAVNGDLTGWSRLLANSARSYIPMSGAQGVLSNAITSSQKDIQGEMLKYLQNRTPGVSHLLPEQIDIWTGKPLNDIENPFLRWLNALSPIKISGTSEPWRQWLLSTGWDGLGRLRKHSSGTYEYSPEEREVIYKYIGEEEIWKELDRLRKNKKFKKSEQILRAHRATGADLDNEKIKLKANLLPLFKTIDKIVRNAQIRAEQRYAEENPLLREVIKDQLQTNQFMKHGNVPAARNVQQKNLEKQNQMQNLLSLPK